MSNGRVITAYFLFCLVPALILGSIFHHPVAFGIGAAIVVVWWIVAWIFGDRILLGSLRVVPFNVGAYAEIAKLVIGRERGPRVGAPSLWMIDSTAPMALSIGLHPRSSSLILTRGLLERLDDKVQVGLVVREMESIRLGATAANTAAATLLWFILLPGKIGTLLSGKQPGEPNVASTILNLLPAFIAAPFAMIVSDRGRVYAIDREAMQKVENPDCIPYALMKLQEAILGSPFNCELALTGCCAINPGSRDPYTALFKSFHPPTPKRIGRLRFRPGAKRQKR